MRFRLIALLGAVCAATGGAPAQDAGMHLGEASFQFLKLHLSPRAAALGGAGAGLAEGLGGAEINPAAAAREGGALVLGQEYPPRQFGTTGSHVSWSLPWSERRVTLHARYLGFEAIPGWDGTNTGTAPYEAHTLKLQAGLAGQAWGFAWGVNGAFAQNNIAEATYAAALANAGVWRSLPAGFSAGVSLQNLGLWTGRTMESGGNVIVPTAFQAGLGYGRSIGAEMRVAAAADARKVRDEGLVFPLGVEWSLREALFVRAGYPVGDSDNGPGLGFGLKWSRFAFHYAYRMHSALSGGHGWTLEIGDL